MAVTFSSCSQSRVPETGDKEIRKAIALYGRGQVIDALALFQSAAEKPLKVYESWEVHNYIGSCYLVLDKFEKALAAYNKSLEENAKNHNVWVNKGVSLRNLDRLDDAEECYRKALELKPDYAELHSSLGSLCIVRDNPSEAVKHFQRAIELNPSLAVAHGNYALALGMLGDFTAADAELSKAARHGYVNVEIVRKQLETMRSNMD
jgi:tetratricopeptide (TPR) repeat protein